MFSVYTFLYTIPAQSMQGILLGKKQTAPKSMPLQMVRLFFTLLKKKYLRIHYLMSKYVQNNIIFTYLYTKSNTFINITKSNKILLFRSLGMLGVRKKKKKLQSHVNFLLGSDIITLFKKLYFKNNLKRIIIKIKGFKRFLRATFSRLHKYLGNLRYTFNKYLRKYKKWFTGKNRAMKMRLRKKKNYRMNFWQRKTETSIKRERAKWMRDLLRVSQIIYCTSVPFGGHNFGKKKRFERYIRKNYY